MHKMQNDPQFSEMWGITVQWLDFVDHMMQHLLNDCVSFKVLAYDIWRINTFYFRSV